jgi:PAS domain S-box-containing protein
MDTTAQWKKEFDQMFEHVFEHSLIGMAILDGNGTFLRLNKKACEIWEYTEKELIGKTWKDITYPDDMSISTHYTDAYKNKSSNFSMVLEKRYVTGCGNIKTCRITTSVVKDDNNNVIYFITQVQDVSHKKEIMASLKNILGLISEKQDKVSK